MKITKIKIRNLFGIKEMDLDNKSILATGGNGIGKTSIIDALRYALTNDSTREEILKIGESNGEILIETDTGLSINRKKRTTKADYKSIKEGKVEVAKPEAFLKELFNEMQLNPIEFSKMSRQEQNRIILNLVEFKWDLNWIREQFGEIPEGVNYELHILEVLYQIQDDKGTYYLNRQDVNRDIRNKKAFIEDIVADIPDNYNYKKWDEYDLGTNYNQLNKIQADNSKIERAKIFKDSYDNKMRGLEADRDININTLDKTIASEKETLKTDIERLKEQIKSKEAILLTVDSKMDDKKKVIVSEFNEKVTQLNADIGVADEYSNKSLIETENLVSEINTAESMKKHLNEYKRMTGLQKEIENLVEDTAEYTRKIELARELPSTILQNATLPIEGLTVVEGKPLINNKPLSNLSTGETMELCVQVAVSNPNSLKLILLDGVESLSTDLQEKLFKVCKDKDLQFIATRTTDENELNIITL